MFAASIVLFILYAGTPPFTRADPKDPYYKLLCTNRHDTFWNAHSKHKPNKDFFSADFKSFMNANFALDPAQRLSLAEMRNHPWMQGPTVPMDKIREEFNRRK